MLDPGHTTTSLNADQMIQFARSVGLEVTPASYGLLADLLVRCRAISGLGLRDLSGRSPFASAVESIRCDSVVS